MRSDPAKRFEHLEGSAHEAHCWRGTDQGCQGQAQGLRLVAKAADPELAALIGHGRLSCGQGGRRQSQALEQTCDQKQRDHTDAEAQPGKSELGQERHRAFAEAAQIAAHADAHYRIVKRERDGRTVTEVERLDREGRIVELAAMLGGGPGDAAALASARELLDRAESWRSGPVAAGGDRSA